MPGNKRRQLIADAALRIIASDGVRRCTSARIAAAVGITDGTVFRHFRNKQEIVEAAIASFEALLDASFPTDDAGTPPLVRLGDFFCHRLTTVSSRPEILRLAFNDRLEEAAGPAGAHRVRAMITRTRAFIADSLEAAQQDGSVRDDVPASFLVWLFVGTVHGAAAAIANAGPGEGATPDPATAWEWLHRVLTVPNADPSPPTPSSSSSKPRRKGPKRQPRSSKP